MNLFLSSTCLYGTLENANNVMHEYYLFVTVLTLSLVPILLFNHTLHRMYKPLATLVDISLVLQLVCSVLYFAEYPYADDVGNCAEVFLSQVLTAVIMFAEFHQIYFLANILGLGKHHFSCWGTLNKLLNILLMLSIMSSFLVLVYFKDYVLLMDSVWTAGVSSIQLYCIYLSRTLAWDRKMNGILSSSDSSIQMFEKLSLLQLLPASFCLLHRLSLTLNTGSFIGEVGSVFLVLDALCVFLFYLKVLLIKENSNVKIDVVDV